MPGRFIRTLFVLMVIAFSVHGQLITSDSNQSLIDQILHVVWEPSSLIRMWVGLDQLFNIVRSWRGVAKKLASLPFGGDGENHVRIQEPRSMRYQKPSVGSQLDRFNQMYASSSLSPIVSHAREKQFKTEPYASFNALGSNLHAVKADPTLDGLKLPPPFLFQPQEIFLNSDWAKLFQKMGRLDYNSLFRKGKYIRPFSPYKNVKYMQPSSPLPNANGFGYPAQLESLKVIAYLLHQLQNGNNLGFSSQGQTTNNPELSHQFKNLNGHSHPMPFRNPLGSVHSAMLANMNGHPRPFHGSNINSLGQMISFNNRVTSASELADLQGNRNMFLKNKKFGHPSEPSAANSNSVMEMTPQERLNMLLLLMRTLGSMHTKKIANINDLKLRTGQQKAVNRNDAGSFQAANFVDRDGIEASEKR